MGTRVIVFLLLAAVEGSPEGKSSRHTEGADAADINVRVLQQYADMQEQDVGQKPCVANRCQNGWHDLNNHTWDCVNATLPTDEKFQAAIRNACSNNDLDVFYQTCTAPCCGCWSAYWPALLDLWGRCGAPESYVKGEGIVGLKAKEDWLCGNGQWGCVGSKWDAYDFTQCTSGPDKQKVKEVFGLFRDRTSSAESCGCIRQANSHLFNVLEECQIPDQQWFVKYGTRRMIENRCGSATVLMSEEFEEASPKTSFAGVALVAVALVAGFAVFSHVRNRAMKGEGYMYLDA